MINRGVLAAGAAVALIASAPAFAQSVDEEVRRVVNNSVSNTVSQVLEEALTRGTEGAAQPSTTVFISPLYNRSDGNFGDGDFEADTFGGLGGALYKLTENVFVHGTLAAARTDLDTSEDITAYAALAGVNYILRRSREMKIWATMEAGVGKTDSDDEDLDGSAWLLRPSVTGSFRVYEMFIAEPSLAVAFTDVFGAQDSEVAKTFEAGLKLKYRAEKFRPQLNLKYSKTMSPNTDDDGLVSIGPELNYEMSAGKTIGLSYSYLTPINADYDFDSHTVIGNFRWTF